MPGRWAVATNWSGPLPRKGTGGGASALPYEAKRAELVRVELTPAGIEIPSTLEIVGEYAVDLQLRGWRATNAIDPTLVPVVDDVNDTYASTQLLRGIHLRFSVRSREADRERDIPTGSGGTLTIGFTAVSIHGYVQSFLRRIAEELPHVDLVLRELVTADQVEAIAAGDIDLGFVRPPITRAALLSRVVQSERLLLAALADDPFVLRGQQANVADLDGRALIMYSPVESRYFYELLLGMTVRAQVRPRYVQYVSQVHTMLALVQAGVGLAIVPESAAALHPDGVAFIELADAQAPVVKLAATWHEAADNPALARGLALLPMSEQLGS